MDDLSPWVRRTGQGLELFVRLTPRSSEDAIGGLLETADGKRHLKARVRAVPEDGKANRALEKLLAKWLGVPPRAVTVVAGAASRLKIVAVAGDPESLAVRLNAISGQDRS